MRRLLLIILSLYGGSAFAGVLPEDRSDVLYHLYDGGGVTIEVEGDPAHIARFEQLLLDKAPPLARITAVSTRRP